ncbi:hypothetical protein IC229_21190 [Spirosoma sp. BT702]|uniref:Uncharacterized protein n=1 Tax=Spirosoma profusum TaxID=2771354 RepID=A0A926Y4F5_9BACT|nr:hypothetical protein [Spirosoma profusum]MBD2703175.1 hypothetical protein [Spirosoma profusum]
MKIVYVLLLAFLASWPVKASELADTLRTTSKPAIRHAFAEYDEEILYYGKRNDYYSVRIYKKDGTLFRLDSYSLLPKTLPNGLSLDSLSRIIHHGPTKIMYPSGQLYLSCEYKQNLLHGPFMVFYEDGSIKRREFYRSGRLTKSQCFTTEGVQQKCEPYYQAAKFLGKPQDLQTYLKKQLGTVLDGDRVRNLTATLTINEIGQIIRVNVDVRAFSLAPQQVTAIQAYMQQTIRNMPEWTPEKLNWQPAVNDGRPIASTCVLSVFRFQGDMQFRLSYQM